MSNWVFNFIFNFRQRPPKESLW